MQNNQNCDKIFTQKRNLSIMTVQEEERQRIARDLHDTSLQTLAHLVHKLELCNLYMDKDVFQAKLEILSIRQNLKDVIEEIRNTIFDLRPMSFDDLGVEETFNRFIERENPDKKFKITSEVEKIDLSLELITLTLYRVIQECVSNAIKHSKGDHIHITAKNMPDNMYKVIIEDNGKGFTQQEADEKTNHFGLSIMRERVSILNGTIDIQSEIGKGTKVIIEFPLPNIEKNDGGTHEH